MCEADQETWMDATLWWQGWQTTVRNLLTAGWQISRRRRFAKRARVRCVGEYIYLTHVERAMIARFSVDYEANSADDYRGMVMLDFMLTRKQLNRASVKETLREIGAEDVADLLDLIKEIQSSYARPTPPPARVVHFRKAA